jgi:hypothetical protein
MVATLAELTERGLLSETELEQMSIPIVGRRERDFLAPFAPSGVFEQLTVAHLEVFDAEDRFWTQYRTDGDAASFGAKWAAFARSSVFPTLASALSGDHSDPRRTEFVDGLEAGVAARLAAAPQQMQIPLAALVIEKKQRHQH